VQKEAGGFTADGNPELLAAKRHKNRKRLNAENILNRNVAEVTGVERGNGEAC
jgi:hypothetical protein